jgi:hypothetical protein
MKWVIEIRHFNSAMLILILIGLQGCIKINSSNPADGETGIPLDTAIKISFNAKPASSAVNPSTIIVTDSRNNQINGTISIVDATVIFKPLSSLESLTEYTVTIKAGVKSSDGSSLSSDARFSFTTEEGNPACVSAVRTHPVDRDVYAGRDSDIRVLFNSKIDPASVNSDAFLVYDSDEKKVSGKISATGSSLIFKPDSALDYLTRYTVAIDSGIKNTNGTPSCSAQFFSFTTVKRELECIKVNGEITGTYPSDGAINIPQHAGIRVSFSAIPEPATVNTGTFIVKDSSGTPIDGVVSSVGTTIIFIPASKLESLGKYTVTMKLSMPGSGETCSCADNSFSFTSTDMKADGLNVIRTTPAGQTTDAARDTCISVVFDADPDPATINSGTFIVKDTMNNPVEGLIAVKDSTAAFRPLHKLALCGTYSVTIKSGVTGASGTGMNNHYSFRFTTVDGSWIKAEEVTSHKLNCYFTIYPRVAIDDEGNAMAAWNQYLLSPGFRDRCIWASKYTQGNGWGTPAVIDDDHINDDQDEYGLPVIAFDNKGNAMIVYQYEYVENCKSRNTTRSCFYSPDRGWGHPVVISPDEDSYHGDYHIVFDQAGNAKAVWATYNHININRYSAMEGWEAAQSIAFVGYWLDESGISVACNDQGDIMVFWGDQVPEAHFQAIRYTPEKGWGRAQTIYTRLPAEDTGWFDTYSALAMDYQGKTLAVFGRHRDVSTGTLCSLTSWYLPGKGWGTPEVQDKPIGSPVMDAQDNVLSIGVENSGSYLGYGTIFTSLYTRDEGWGASQYLTTAAGGRPRMVMDSQGNAIAVWYVPISIYNNDVLRMDVMACRYIAGRGWGTPQLISPAWDGISEVDGYPEIALNKDGMAVVVWSKGGTVWSARFE